MPEVLLKGDGLAATACAVLLERARWQVYREGPPRTKLPSVVLNQVSQKLLTDLFAVPTLLADAYPIETRVVRWGAETVSLPHKAVAISEGTLMDRLPKKAWETGTAPYCVVGMKPLPNDLPEISFGERKAEAVRVQLRKTAAAHACWVEAVADGWLFAVCEGEGRASMLAVGDTAEALLAQSVLLRGVVDSVESTGASFSCQPRIAPALKGDNWLACGSAAMSFDPICGEGTGHSIREAILASAVLKAHADGEDWGELTKLYEQRLRGGFRRHLEQCRKLYASGGDSAWWRAQQDSVEAGIKSGIGSSVDSSRYRLDGYDLLALRR
jgi:hypothetical protein